MSMAQHHPSGFAVRVSMSEGQHEKRIVFVIFNRIQRLHAASRHNLEHHSASGRARDQLDGWAVPQAQSRAA